MGERKVVEDVDHSKPESEHDLEEFLIKNGGVKLREFIQSQFGIEFEDIKNQYPVGVFSNEVKNENAVFTGGKSAIDMYARGKDGSFNIFELKAEENVQIGIVSELFFYSSLIRDTLEGKFKFKNTRNEFENSKHVNAFFLASRLHPLIIDEVLDMLNIPNNKITYRKIIYTFMKSKSGPILVL